MNHVSDRTSQHNNNDNRVRFIGVVKNKSLNQGKSGVSVKEDKSWVKIFNRNRNEYSNGTGRKRKIGKEDNDLLGTRKLEGRVCNRNQRP